mmetsp:Transcript_69598/g.193661  ORF Transcript_69598/g.193661 Transcript_69598/m.193661 type:complete len:257 (+) Transcript_69598:71-841(+)
MASRCPRAAAALGRLAARSGANEVTHIAPAGFSPHRRMMHRTAMLHDSQDLTWGTYVSKAYKEAGFSKDASVSFYDKSAHYYDQLARPGTWLAPFLVANHAREIVSQRGTAPNVARTLDFGAGTGQLGVALKQEGFETIDAVEPSTKMTELAPKGTYSEVYMDDKQAGQESYDLVVSTGVIGTHVDPHGLQALLSKVKVGGAMVVSCKACSWQEDGFSDMVNSLSNFNHNILDGPRPLNKDMPDQMHVIVELARVA